MLPNKPRALGPEHTTALILLVFSGGALLDAILRVTYRYTKGDGTLPQVLLAVVPALIVLGIWLSLRGRRELLGTTVLQLLVAVVVSVLTFHSSLPLSWYLGIGLVIWAMRLGANLLMWVGTSLLVLTAGAQFGAIEYSGVLFLPFAITPMVFLAAAAYFQWHQVRHQPPEEDPEVIRARELQRERYGRDVGQ